MTDVWSVRKTADQDNVSTGGTGLEETELEKVLEKAKQGIGVS